MSHLTAEWARLASQDKPATKTASLDETVFWHVTDNPHFTIDPDYHAKGAESEYGDDNFRYSTPGLFVTHNPELWKFLWRPMGKVYAAEIECAPGAARRMGSDTDDRDQWFIAKDRLDGCRVLRIVPVEDAIKETRKEGKGFALLRSGMDDPLIHIADHKKGWGSSDALCGAWCSGEPLKWSTKEYVLREMASHPNVCPQCLGKLQRQRS